MNKIQHKIDYKEKCPLPNILKYLDIGDVFIRGGVTYMLIAPFNVNANPPAPSFIYAVNLQNGLYDVLSYDTQVYPVYEFSYTSKHGEFK